MAKNTKHKLSAFVQARSRGLKNVRLGVSYNGVFGMANKADGTRVVLLGSPHAISVLDADVERAKLIPLSLSESGKSYMNQFGAAFDPKRKTYFQILSTIDGANSKLSALGVASLMSVPFDAVFDDIVKLLKSGMLVVAEQA